MKSVLISIQPKWCELIASGKKTIEVRKTAPKQVPFKAYIYETYDKKYVDIGICWGNGKCFEHGCKKVIGEFVCDYVYENMSYDCEACRVSVSELKEYADGKPLYGWHISDLKIYDKPRELSEFWAYNGKLHKRYDSEEDFCCYNDTNEYGEALTDCGDAYNNILNCYRCWEEWSGWCHHVTRPPQSWCYVEELL